MEDVTAKKTEESLGGFVFNKLCTFKKLRIEKRKELFKEAILKEDGGLYDPMVTYRAVGKTKPVM